MPFVARSVATDATARPANTTVFYNNNIIIINIINNNINTNNT